MSTKKKSVFSLNCRNSKSRKFDLTFTFVFTLAKTELSFGCKSISRLKTNVWEKSINFQRAKILKKADISNTNARFFNISFIFCLTQGKFKQRSAKFTTLLSYFNVTFFTWVIESISWQYTLKPSCSILKFNRRRILGDPGAASRDIAIFSRDAIFCGESLLYLKSERVENIATSRPAAPGSPRMYTA